MWMLLMYQQSVFLFETNFLPFGKMNLFMNDNYLEESMISKIW